MSKMFSSPADNAPAWGGNPIWIAGVAKSAPQLLWVRDQLAELKPVEEAYVPAIKTTRIVYGKKEDYETPLAGWGRYFFVRMVIGPFGEWAKVRYQEGVQCLLPAHSLKPLPIGDSFIQRMKAEIAEGRHNPIELIKALRRYLQGEAVDVVSGDVLKAYPEGVSGEVISHSLKTNRVTVELSCAGGLKVVKLPPDQLAPSGSSRRQARQGSHLRRNGAITRAHQFARAC